MLYLALTFWLLVVVLTAWGVQRLWVGMVPPRAFNGVLLPGTLVAQVGHVLGLLVTGATVNNTTLYKDDSGDPEATPNPQPRVPVIGPVVIAMLPLIACGAGIHFVTRYLGRAHLDRLTSSVVTDSLPRTAAGVWQLLRNQITLVESWVNAARLADYSDWRTWAFYYLLICLAVRTAPFTGYLRGALGAIAILGVGAAVVSSLFDVADPRVRHGWAVLNLTVGTLLFLLLVSLVIRGVVWLVAILRNGA